MPFGPSPPRQLPSSRPPGARRINAPLELLHRLTSMRMSGYTSYMPGGVSSKNPGIIFRIGLTGSNGIPALAGSALSGADVSDCSLLVSPDDPYSASLQMWESKYIGFNLSSQSVSATTLIISVYMEGLWLTMWENCPAPSSG